MEFLTCSCKVCSQRCVCLGNGLPCIDVYKCKDCNNNKQDDENNCDDLVEEEESACYDSDYSDNSECEYT